MSIRRVESDDRKVELKSRRNNISKEIREKKENANTFCLIFKKTVFLRLFCRRSETINHLRLPVFSKKNLDNL